MTAQPAQGISPAQALTLVRSAYYTNVVCCVVLMLLGWALFALVGMSPWPRVGWIGFAVGMVLFVVLTGVGLFARQQSYKRNWVGDRVTPKGYMIGMMTYHTIHELTVIVAVGFMMVAGALWPAVVPGVLATLVMAVAYPNGRVMQVGESKPDPPV